MRKMIFVFTILVLPILMSFLISYPYDNYPTGLKGRVKRCIEYTYEIDTFGLTPKVKLFTKDIFEFNKKGQIVKIKNYQLNDNGRYYLFASSFISYDSLEREFKTQINYGKGNFKSLITLDYKQAKLIEKKYYEKDPDSNKFSFQASSFITIVTNDSIMQIVEDQTKINQKTIRIYDKMGSFISKKTIHWTLPEDNAIYFYKYDSNGNQIEFWKKEDNKNKLQGSFKYSNYDKEGNWLIQNIYYNETILTSIIKRKIIYY